jgi:RNA-directed DNA polymerase
MKRIGNLYEKISSIDNLILADKMARRQKQESYGVKRHDMNKDSNINKLQKMLQDKEFHTSPYNVFKIYEPKEREIYQLPYFPDRIVHHAIMNILEPIWHKIFIAQTYSCIKGRGIHKCSLDVQKALTDKENTKYCLKLDIAKFYPSIDHDVLKAIVRRKVKCKDTLQLLDSIIESAPGVPIGNYVSQYFANLYLAYFDHYMKEQAGVKYYFRYADDIVILHASKEYLHGVLVQINDYISTELNLSLKQNYQIFPVESRGIDFVGYVFFHSHVLLRKSIKKNLCRKVAKIKDKQLKESEIKTQLGPWWGWAKHCNSKNLINSQFKIIGYEVNFKRKTLSIAKIGA